MAGIARVFVFLDETSIYTFLDLALNFVDSVLWGGVWTPSNDTHFKPCLSSTSVWTSFFQDRGGDDSG